MVDFSSTSGESISEKIMFDPITDCVPVSAEAISTTYQIPQHVQQQKQQQQHDTLDDPIIRQIFAACGRQIADEYTPEEELERQRRMISMLRNSKHYRKQIVQNANAKWNLFESNVDAAMMNAASNAKLKSSPKSSQHRVSFCEDSQIIDYSNKFTTRFY